MTYKERINAMNTMTGLQRSQLMGFVSELPLPENERKVVEKGGVPELFDLLAQYLPMYTKSLK